MTGLTPGLNKGFIENYTQNKCIVETCFVQKLLSEIA